MENCQTCLFTVRFAPPSWWLQLILQNPGNDERLIRDLLKAIWSCSVTGARPRKEPSTRWQKWKGEAATTPLLICEVSLLSHEPSMSQGTPSTKNCYHYSHNCQHFKGSLIQRGNHQVLEIQMSPCYHPAPWTSTIRILKFIQCMVYVWYSLPSV